MLDFEKLTWKDYGGNPLLEPPWPEWMIADPTVLLPEESPDGRWHMIANSVMRLRHYTSDDGLNWERGRVLCPGIRPFIIKHNNRYFLFYEHFIKPRKSVIKVRVSQDMEDWCDDVVALEPSLEWHGKIMSTCSNPCVVVTPDEFIMFYSGNVVFLKDCLFFEPRHIGVARSKVITGPYIPDSERIFKRDSGDWFRNLGAGAIKVIYDAERGIFWGFNNGIYEDENGHSRSSIRLLKSSDAVNWEEAGTNPIAAPEDKGWKKALVYALDVKIVNGKAWMYYNARDGWFIGKERIGLCVGE